MVVTFPRAVTFGSAALTSGTGNVASTSQSGAEVIVNLTGVANAQTITLTLFGVSDGVHTNDVAVKLSFLLGDVSASGSVTTPAPRTFSDLDVVDGQLGQPVTAENFRADVNANGSVDEADESLVQSNSGKLLPQ